MVYTRRLIWAVVLGLALSGCASLSSDDFDVSSRHVQVVPLDGVKTVIVRCWCPVRGIVEAPGATALQLRILGRYSSLGYHGEQEKPRRLSADMIAFAVQQDGDTLTLDSKEYGYMHHRKVVEELLVTKPPGFDVRLDLRSSLEASELQ